MTRFILQAIAPADGEDYGWDAFTARVSPSMQWRATAPGAADGGDVRREGRLSGDGGGRGVVALGDAASVRTISIDTNTFNAVALLDALRRAGADVSFQGDFESYSEYVLTPSGGDVTLLTTNSTCIPFDPRPGEICRNYVTLTFNPW